MKLISVLSKDKERHTNKVFTCKFFPENENLLYSGGWDRYVKFWDIRAKKLTHNVHGPQICGDTIDMSKDGH
jgi:WD40 repeat protein